MQLSRPTTFPTPMCLTEAAGGEEHRQFKRMLQLRWHPDKFQQMYGERLADEDRERIMHRITTLFQLVNRS